MSVLETPPPMLEPLPPEESTGLWGWLFTTNRKFSVGTLKYTGFGLIMVFIWLLWGDFVFTMLDENVPGILPLKLNKLGAGDFLNGSFKAFAYLITFVFAPAVSFRSDRTRSRWGRRIPYLFWSTPVVGIFLVLIGCYESLTHAVTGGAASIRILGHEVSQTAVTLTIFGVLMVGWDFANIFVNTVYWYLFNDVVPEQYLSRFLALFRVVGTLAGMAYNQWVFPHSITHFRIIFIIAGIAYTVGFLLMCLFVREGDYPPPPENVGGRTGLLAAAETYAKECFTHRLYWFFFLANACTYVAAVVGMFGLMRDTGPLGIDMSDLKNYRNAHKFVSLLLCVPAGWIADWWHPLRLYIITRLLCLIGTALWCVYIFKDFGPHGNLVFMYWVGLAFMPMLAISSAAELPMYMRLLPKAKYGQFCSANAMVRAASLFFGVMLAGEFMDLLKPHVGDRRYCYIPVWTLAFEIVAAVFLILLCREWKRHGGNKHYVAPGTENEHPPTGAFRVLTAKH
jgi:hypothetical protein